MRVQRVVMPDTGVESWTVVDDDLLAVESVERYLGSEEDRNRKPV